MLQTPACNPYLSSTQTSCKLGITSFFSWTYPAASLIQKEVQGAGAPAQPHSCHHGKGPPGPHHRHHQHIKSLSLTGTIVFPTSVATRKGLDTPAINLTHTGSPRISSRSFLPIRFSVFLYFRSSNPIVQITQAFPSTEVSLLLSPPRLKKSHRRNPGVNQINQDPSGPSLLTAISRSSGQAEFPMPREAREKLSPFSCEITQSWVLRQD